VTRTGYASMDRERHDALITLSHKKRNLACAVALLAARLDTAPGAPFEIN
jgi:hypothetical protein